MDSMQADADRTVVGRSVNARVWRLKAVDERLVLALIQRHGLPDAVARALAARKVGLDAAPDFLAPTLRRTLPDPSCLADMDAAAERIAKAIASGEGIAVFGDYDVDGATSSALLLRFLRALGREARLHIPDRIDEGYGPNAPALLALRAQGASLVVTVDCGAAAPEPLAAAAAAGLDVVVLDHHRISGPPPPAVAVVNPNRPDDASGLGALAACGVTFLTLVAVNRALRRDGFFRGRDEPDLLSMLDLVALGTVCDVVPLAGLNRAFVAQGLKVLGGRHGAGVRALAEIAGLGPEIDVEHLAFAMGPRINAGGRVGQADLGARLLATDDPVEAATLAEALNGHNESRKAIEAAVLRQAAAEAETQAGDGDEPGRLILVAGENWHPGVVGIVASRLKERFHRPAVAVAASNGQGRASGRSIPGVDLGALIGEARRAGLVVDGGGHPMAAGFTVDMERLPSLRRFLDERLADQGEAPPPMVELDGGLSVGGVTVPLAAAVARLAPFGAGNPEPRFMVASAEVARAQIVGGTHIRCQLTGADGARLSAIAFRAVGTPLGEALLAKGGAPLHLAGTIRRDRWNGEDRVQFRIEDAAKPWDCAAPGGA